MTTTPDPTRPIRIANCSGFYGDRLSAAREMVDGGPIDVLTGDYLAELTMLILWKSRNKGKGGGWASTFLTQMEDVLGTCIDKGIKVVSNAGGLDPAGLAARIQEISDRLGLGAKVAHVEGDDLIPRLPALREQGVPFTHMDTGKPLSSSATDPITANAYLGGFGVAAGLAAGADVVITPRITDASLVTGPAAWWHGWTPEDLDALAGSVAAGHVIECGAQACGGNYSWWQDLPDDRYPGFPIAEIEADGSSVITKHPGTGGVVNIGTVTAQLLYETATPEYGNPDVVAHFDTLQLTQEGPDRVRLSGTRGTPPPPTLKVAMNLDGGFMNTATMLVTGLDIEEKARRAETMLFAELGGREQFQEVDVRLDRTDREDAPDQVLATARLTVTVKDRDRAKVGRRFSSAVTALMLGGYAGFYTANPPADARNYGVYWPTLVDASAVEHRVVLPDGTVQVIDHPARTGSFPVDPADRTWEVPGAAEVTRASAGAASSGGAGSAEAGGASAGSGATAGVFAGEETRRVPLGTICAARSGDKGGNGNIGLYTRTPREYAWLAEAITAERFQELMPEAAPLVVDRYELPNLNALNFVVRGVLGEGVASSTRQDPQAKAIGEYIRSRYVDVPVSLLD
ncbi:acyclic terpene utilization AtuA family protein [Brevibacterium samyangense]|uniref:DUF1446 domain-containing protein n=1 Tax=Brevibacterium samyangense TaxID=366888 RepID=A0ABN2T3G5_9MICO